MGWALSVEQPPLPLQEFLPLQPLSLALQPPLPLQLFWPLQECFSFAFLSALASSCAVVAEAFPEKPEALMVALVPASKPATAAPVRRYLFDFVIFPNVLLNDLTAHHFWQSFLPEDRLSHESA